MSFRIGTFLASFTILLNVFRSPAGIGGRAACGPVVLRYRNLVVATGDGDEESIAGLLMEPAASENPAKRHTGLLSRSRHHRCTKLSSE
jgi:hypothetical protein